MPGAAPGAPSQTIGESASSCPADPADRTTVPITKPALGMSADYGLPPAPNTSLPNPEGKSTWSLNYSKAGVDTGEIVIRGGSHLDFSFIPNQAFGASLRGPDLIAWYTTAWFDKYLKHSSDADAELLTQRWRDDPIEASIDPNHDGNAFSFYYYSRLDIHLSNGQVWDCEDLRDGCPGMVPESDDGFPGTYSYLALDTSPDTRLVDRQDGLAVDPPVEQRLDRLAGVAPGQRDVDLRVELAGGDQVREPSEVGGARAGVLELGEDVQAVELALAAPAQTAPGPGRRRAPARSRRS